MMTLCCPSPNHNTTTTYYYYHPRVCILIVVSRSRGPNNCVSIILASRPGLILIRSTSTYEEGMSFYGYILLASRVDSSRHFRKSTTSLSTITLFYLRSETPKMAGKNGSMRLPDLARWPLPSRGDARPADHVATLSPVTVTLPLMPVHVRWLESSTSRYGFDDVGETLRHLLYLANAEPKANKRLIFRIKRCLHCHVGARASQHTKEEVTVQVHRFQWTWLETVTARCDEVKSVEKAFRIICDYYQSRVKQADVEGGVEASLAKEQDIFSEKREGDLRLAKAMARYSNQNTAKKALGHETALDMDAVHGCDLGILSSDSAACSEEETLMAIARCQVGRGSASYAEAKGETPQETERRRAEERTVEESEEARKERALIGKALGSVMG